MVRAQLTVQKGPTVSFLSNRTRTIVVAGAFAGAVAAAPVVAFSTTPAPAAEAAPACLAWFGNKDDGNCLSYSNGNGVGVGTPRIGIGPGGLYSGPVLPGTSWNTSIPIG